jgi:hypothetical protein
MKRCPHCGQLESRKWGVIFHTYGCPNSPKPSPGPFKSPRSPEPEVAWRMERARQDRETEALRGAVPAGCALHGFDGPAEQCPGCEIVWREAAERRAHA